MSEDSTNRKTQIDELEQEDMLNQYDFSKSKPGRYRGVFKGFIRVLADGTEQVIEPKQTKAD